MFTNDETMIKILRYALSKATSEWNREDRKQLSKEAFETVVIKEYKDKLEYPNMNPEVIKL